MATARLRKAVHYPDSGDEGDGRGELDEEEQERVIAKLRQENEKHNAMYKRAFAVLPMIAIFAYISNILSSASVGWSPIYALCIASLAATSYSIVYCPLQLPDRKGKKSMRLVEQENASPRRHVRLANAVIAATLALTGLRRRASDAGDVSWLLCVIPGILLLLCYMAERSMLSVNVDELERLKYNLKGA